MNRHQPAAPREELREILAVRRVRDVAGFLRVQDQHVGVVELGLRGEGVRARRPRAARVQERHPVLEEARMVVCAWTV